MAYSDVQVTFEFGHRSAIRTKITPEGYTHDWEVFVRGADNADLSHFVEKVVFYLHETFPKPKRVIKEQPYSVKESGYAGFNLLIDIYFKNKDEPKKFKHNYDLNLQSSGPPITKTLREKYVFTNPAGDFRKKLLRGGGIGIDAPMPSDKPFSGDGPSKSQKSSSSTLAKQPPPPELVKKHKKEFELKPTSQFSELFGDPIKKTKVSPDPKKLLAPSASKPTSASTSGGGKGPSVKPSTSSERPSNSDKVKSTTQKEEKKEEKKRDKSSSKDVSDKKMAKPSSPSLSSKAKEEPKVKDESAEKKKKDKKHKEEKEVKAKHPTEKAAGDKLIKEKENKKSPKPSSSLSLLEERMRHKESDKQHKSKHKKKDKEKKDKKSDSKDKKRESKSKEETKFKEPEPHSPSPPAPTKIEKPAAPSSQREKPVSRPLSKLFAEFSDDDNSDSNNSMSGDEDLMEFPPPARAKPEEPKQRESNSAPKVREVEKKAKKEEEKRRKRKRSTDSDDDDIEPTVNKKEVPNNHEMLPPPPVPMSTLRDEFSGMTPEYESELRELQRKIMSLDDDDELQRLVNLITETGKYEMTKKTFDFDLCDLDRTTVTRLQDFFRVL